MTMRASSSSFSSDNLGCIKHLLGYCVMRVYDSFGFVDPVARKRFDCCAEEHGSSAPWKRARTHLHWSAVPVSQRDLLYRLKILENRQLSESGLLTEVEHEGVESAFLKGIQFRSSIKGEQFIHAEFCASEGIQGTRSFP